MLEMIVLLFTNTIVSAFSNFSADYGSHTGIEQLFAFSIVTLKIEGLLCLSFIPGCLIAGFIAGSKKLGVWAGLALFTYELCANILFIILPIEYMIEQNTLLLILFATYLPLAFITQVTFGYIGGALMDRFQLYRDPLPHSSKLKLS